MIQKENKVITLMTYFLLYIRIFDFIVQDFNFFGTFPKLAYPLHLETDF